MTLGCKVNDAVHMLLLHKFVNGIEIAYVRLDKLVVRSVLNVFQVGKVASIGQLVEIDNFVVRVFVDKQSYYMAADKTCATGYDNSHDVSRD